MDIFWKVVPLHSHFYMFTFQSKLRMSKKETYIDPWLLRVPPPSILKISQFFPHSTFMTSTILRRKNC